MSFTLPSYFFAIINVAAFCMAIGLDKQIDGLPSGVLINTSNASTGFNSRLNSIAGVLLSIC